MFTKPILVEISGLDDEGRGRGTVNINGVDFDIAVRGALPGDTVWVQIERVFTHRQLAVGSVISFIQKNNLHLPRVCPHKGPCPACPLHGVDLSIMLAIKKARIEQALQRHQLDTPVDDVLFNPLLYGNRQKVKLMVGGTPGKLVLGHYVPYSHAIVPAHLCPHAHPTIVQAASDLLAVINQLSLSPSTERNGGIKAVILRATQEGVAAILITTSSLTKEQFDVIASLPSLISLTEHVDETNSNSLFAGKILKQAGLKTITPLDVAVPTQPDAFCQADPQMALAMYSLVAEFLITSGANGNFLDGYAGIGGFSQALKKRGASNIVAVEQSASCLASLKYLAVTALQSNMRDALLSPHFPKQFTGIVVDPPRKGLGDDAEKIAHLGTQRLALISCDPDAGARDLAVLIKHHYIIEKIIPIDLFGPSPDVEMVSLLSRT